MRSYYGKPQSYSSRSHSARKTVGCKHLPKNNPKVDFNVDFTIYIVSKYLCVDMASCDIQKYFMLI